jgi:hypothetical protein
MKFNLRSLIRFSIRDLMLLTVIVGLAAWWWTERSRLQRENWRLIRENDVLNVKYLDEHNRMLAASAEAKMRRVLHAEIATEMEQMKRNAILSDSLPSPSNPPSE